MVSERTCKTPRTYPWQFLQTLGRGDFTGDAPLRSRRAALPRPLAHTQLCCSFWLPKLSASTSRDGCMAFASNSISFSHFADLCETLASLAPRRAGQKRKAAGDGPTVSKQLQVVRNWIKSMKEVDSPGEDGLLPEGTVRIFLRLFFPDEGPRRRYVTPSVLYADPEQLLGPRMS